MSGPFLRPQLRNPSQLPFISGPSPDLNPHAAPSHTRNPLYMQRQQGPGRVLLKPSTTEGQVANLLALGIEQEGAHGRRNHIRPRRGPDQGRSHRGYTCRGKDSEQREKETRVGGERERLLSHRPEPPKTSKVLKPRQMCSRCL